jgi:DNA polymerase
MPAAPPAGPPLAPSRKGRVVLLPHPRHRDGERGDEAPAPATTLAAARSAAEACRRCPLWEHATGTVFGEGPEGARVMLVGEQPGDREGLRACSKAKILIGMPF